METVIALGMTVVCFSLLSFSYRHFQAIRAEASASKEIEFHLFLHQFEQDIREMDYVHHSQKELKFQKWNTETEKIDDVYYERYFYLLRRRVAKQGHQPLLTDVEAISFDVVSSFLDIEVVFTNGEVHRAEIPLSFNENSIPNE